MLWTSLVYFAVKMKQSRQKHSASIPVLSLCVGHGDHFSPSHSCEYMIGLVRAVEKFKLLFYC